MKRDNINYVLVGAVVALAFGLLLATLFAITGRGGAAARYYVTLDNVAGLGFGAPVYYEGFKIGQVDGIEPLRDQSGTRYRIQLAVRADWPIPRDSVAQRQASGLLADMAIGIREGSSGEMLAVGGEIPGMESGDVFSAMNDLAGELTLLTRERLRPLVDTLSTRIDSITGSVDASAPELLGQARELLVRLNGAAERANAVLDQPNRTAIAEILNEVKGLAVELRRTRANADQVLSALGDTVDENRPALRQTVADLERTIGALANRIEAITHHLESSSRNLDEFSREIRRSPNRLLFTPAADPVEE